MWSKLLLPKSPPFSKIMRVVWMILLFTKVKEISFPLTLSSQSRRTSGLHCTCVTETPRQWKWSFDFSPGRPHALFVRLILGNLKPVVSRDCQHPLSHHRVNQLLALIFHVWFAIPWKHQNTSSTFEDYLHMPIIQFQTYWSKSHMIIEFFKCAVD